MDGSYAVLDPTALRQKPIFSSRVLSCFQQQLRIWPHRSTHLTTTGSFARTTAFCWFVMIPNLFNIAFFILLLEILTLELNFTKSFQTLSHFVSSGWCRITSDILVWFSVGFVRKALRLPCLDLKNLQIEFHCSFIWVAPRVLYTLIH